MSGYSCIFVYISVPDDFSWDPSLKVFAEPSRRPEIRNATVEFIAPSEYMVRVLFHFLKILVWFAIARIHYCYAKKDGKGY